MRTLKGTLMRGMMESNLLSTTYRTYRTPISQIQPGCPWHEDVEGNTQARHDGLQPSLHHPTRAFLSPGQTQTRAACEP